MSDKAEIKTNTYLTFTLGDEQYALLIEKAREVLEITNITKVPRTPEFMRGVINLRGSVVPVCDIRLKFGISPTEKTIDTRIVVIEILVEEEMTLIGILADSVQEVIELDDNHIEPPPKIGTSISIDFILGVGKRNEQFIILLDIEKIFSQKEIKKLKEAHTTKIPKKNTNTPRNEKKIEQSEENTNTKDIQGQE